jgi:pimeloyl-ACP methyl ester carboxylesterase
MNVVRLPRSEVVGYLMSLLFMLLTALGAAQAGPRAALPTSRSVPVNRTVGVNGVSLHYLDWGGTGQALIFLPAACETAHVYGDIAPAFTDRFWVLGPTTRGCGQSGRAGAYDLDAQLRDVEGFLDALQIERATIAGFSASGGKAIRFARVYPSRVRRLVIFDSVYSYIAPELEDRVGAAITRRLGGGPDDSADLHRRHHEAWELGAWSASMDRDLRETYAVSPGGLLRPVAASEWWSAFGADMKAGRYFETVISHPALMFFAVDLDQERLKQFDATTRAELRPLAEETDRRRREQIEEFKRNGPHVRVIEMPGTAHYCFVHKPQEVIRDMRRFLQGVQSARRSTHARMEDG